MKEIPQPEAIVDLVEELTRYPWPKSKAEQEALFKRLGWSRGTQSLGHVSADAAVHFRIATRDDGPPVIATSREIDGVIESVFLDLRLDSASPDPEATKCFDAIVSQLTSLHGEPIIPWHGQRGSRKMWNVNGIDIDVTWNDSRSSLTIGVQDERVFAEVEAYARDN
ncbi:hypothetical protein [Arthrobacter sp. HLT1-20]